MGIKAKLTGAWRKVKDSLADAHDAVLGPMQSDLEILGDAIRDQVLTNMDTSKGPKLAKSTVRKKLKEGRPFPSKQWFETGHIMNKGLMDRLVVRTGAKATLSLVPTDAIHPEAGIPVHDVMFYGEYGTKKQPPRPVIRPVQDSLEDGTNPAFIEFRKRLVERIKVVLS